MMAPTAREYVTGLREFMDTETPGWRYTLRERMDIESPGWRFVMMQMTFLDGSAVEAVLICRGGFDAERIEGFDPGPGFRDGDA